tara:strand:- start:416 stop:625 length:210 start_codon:yes stop_codon:yes gene_type:complete
MSQEMSKALLKSSEAAADRAYAKYKNDGTARGFWDFWHDIRMLAHHVEHAATNDKLGKKAKTAIRRIGR